MYPKSVSSQFLWSQLWSETHHHHPSVLRPLSRLGPGHQEALFRYHNVFYYFLLKLYLILFVKAYWQNLTKGFVKFSYMKFHLCKKCWHIFWTVSNNCHKNMYVSSINLRYLDLKMHQSHAHCTKRDFSIILFSQNKFSVHFISPQGSLFPKVNFVKITQ